MTFSGHAQLTSTTKRQAWARPPIDVDFQVLMFTSSGLIVRFLKVFEKSNYHSVKWVRYLTKASGSYQIRVSVHSHRASIPWPRSCVDDLYVFPCSRAVLMPCGYIVCCILLEPVDADMLVRWRNLWTYEFLHCRSMCDRVIYSGNVKSQDKCHSRRPTVVQRLARSCSQPYIWKVAISQGR